MWTSFFVPSAPSSHASKSHWAFTRRRCSSACFQKSRESLTFVSCWLVVSPALELQMSATCSRPRVWSLQQPVWLSYPLPEPLPTPPLTAALHKSTSYSSAAAVDLDDSQSLPPGFPLPSAVSHQLSREWEAGKGERERVVHSGFKAPLPRPLSSLSWRFPLSTWPVSTLNPGRSVWVFSSGTLATSVLFTSVFLGGVNILFCTIKLWRVFAADFKFLLCFSYGHVCLKPIFSHC